MYLLFFHLNDYTYLSIVDRFSGWLCIYYFSGEATSETLINIFRDLFIAYGVSEILSSDGGPQFTSAEFQRFLKEWGVEHSLSSVAYPQSNGRAELGVKTAKRIIHNNTLQNDNAARAILQYRNTPLPDIKLSPSQILLHRQLRDSIPAHPDHYKLHKDWIISAEERDTAYAKRNQVLIHKYNATAHELPELGVGTEVVVQREDRHKQWDRRGCIVQALPNRQCRIRMLPSGRITLRNRRFIRKFTCINAPMHKIIPSGPDIQNTVQPLQSTIETPLPAPVIHQVPSETPSTYEHNENPLNNTPPTTSVQKIPMTLRKLQSYNNPGLSEWVRGKGDVQ